MIPENKFTDKAGNFNTISNIFQWTHDTTPAVTTITTIIPDNGFYNSFMTINISINKLIHPDFPFTISDIIVYRDDFTNPLPDGQATTTTALVHSIAILYKPSLFFL